MDIACYSLRNVVIDDKIDALEIKTTCHEFGCNQHPNIAQTELIDDIVTLDIHCIIKQYKHTWQDETRYFPIPVLVFYPNESLQH